MNQYRCIVVECCGKCIHSAYRSPTERFCNREKPYWTLRLDQWADGISSCCTLPTHTDFQSGWEKVLDELLNWKPGYKQYRGNWIVKVDALYTKIEELRQAGELNVQRREERRNAWKFKEILESLRGEP